MASLRPRQQLSKSTFAMQRAKELSWVPKERSTSLGTSVTSSRVDRNNLRLPREHKLVGSVSNQSITVLSLSHRKRRTSMWRPWTPWLSGASKYIRLSKYRRRRRSRIRETRRLGAKHIGLSSRGKRLSSGRNRQSEASAPLMILCNKNARSPCPRI